MHKQNSAGVEIAYIDEGDGAPVVLVHGFASNHRVNWVSTGWVSALVKAGRRVIALDNRGHGESEKLYDPADYGTPLMAGDIVRLLDHLNVETADMIGYSMGARITAFFALDHPDRLRTGVLSGLGHGLVAGVGAPEPIAAALLAPSLADVSDPTGRAFRQFAEQTGSDRRALAACISASRQTLSPRQLAGIRNPMLVAVGSDDPIAGDPGALAALIPDAQAYTIPGRDHMKAVGDRKHKEAVLSFLAAPRAKR